MEVKSSMMGGEPLDPVIFLQNPIADISYHRQQEFLNNARHTFDALKTDTHLEIYNLE